MGLVITRKVDQDILIDGGKIVIRVVEICGDKVRIKIDAPENITIDRREVHEAKNREVNNDQ